MIKDDLDKFTAAFAELITGLSNRISHLEKEAREHGWEPPPPLPPPPPPNSQEVS